MVKHHELTDPYLHLPKGCAAANLGDVYIADGAGSGAWTSKLPYYYEGDRRYFTEIVKTAASASTRHWVIPYAGRVIRFSASLSVSPDVTHTVTCKVQGTTAGTISIPNTATAYEIYDVVASGYSDTSFDFTANQYITMVSNGETTIDSSLYMFIELLLEA